MAIWSQSREQLVQQHQFAAIRDEALEGLLGIVGAIFCTVKEVGVICGLFKLHSDIEQADIVVPIGALDQTLEVLSRLGHSYVTMSIKGN